jgi:hypothetical protein
MITQGAAIDEAEMYKFCLTAAYVIPVDALQSAILY